jgi:HemY protein
MRYLAWILGLFAVAAAFVSVVHNTAYVLLVYPPYRVELSLTLFAALFLLVFVSVYGLVRLIAGILQLPAYVRKFRADRAQKKSRKLLDEELAAFFEGRYADAEKAATRAMEKGDTSAFHPIIAARSAHELHEFTKRDAYLSAAGDKAKGDPSMRLTTTGRFLLDQHDPRGALDALQELRDSGVTDHLGALTLEMKAHQQADNWNEVLNVLYQIEKRDGIDATQAAQLRQQAWLGLIRQQKDLQGLSRCLKNIPADYKRRGKIAAAAARALIRFGGDSLAQQLLTDSLNAQWDSELVAVYGDCHTDDVVAQIKQAEKWLALHSQDAGLLLALGKLCLHQQLWGKAQNYLDASISIAPGPAAYTALAELAEKNGKSGEAFKYRQQAMGIKQVQDPR